MEEIEDDTSVGKGGSDSGNLGRAHVQDHLGNGFGLGSVGRHGREELRHGLGTAPFDHQQKLMAFRVEHNHLPPERLPRRVARGFGVQPHQTGSFHPLKTSRSQNQDGFHFSIVFRLTGRDGGGAVMVAVNSVLSFALLPP